METQITTQTAQADGQKGRTSVHSDTFQTGMFAGRASGFFAMLMAGSGDAQGLPTATQTGAQGHPLLTRSLNQTPGDTGTPGAQMFGKAFNFDPTLLSGDIAGQIQSALPEAGDGAGLIKDAMAFIKSLIQGTPGTDQQIFGQNFKTDGQVTVLNDENTGEGMPGLIAAGFSPQQLTQLNKMLEGATNNPQGGLAVAMIAFLPDQAQTQIQAGGQAGGDPSVQSAIAQLREAMQAFREAIQTGPQGQGRAAPAAESKAAAENLPPRQTLQQMLQSLQKGTTDQSTTSANTAGHQIGSSRWTGEGAQSEQDRMDPNTLKQMVQQARAGHSPGGGNAANSANGNSAGTPGIIQGTMDHASFLQQVNSALMSAMSAQGPAQGQGLSMMAVEGVFWDISPQGQDLNSYTPTLPMGSTPGASASHMMHSAQAGQTHPASQMVAMQLQKMGPHTGQTKNLTLQLDPPDLGRVQIRMEMSKDNQVKAHLLVEKPETFVMLQRDSQALDRALNNAGLDMGENGLEFELAQDQSQFDDFMKDQNEGQHGRGNGQEGDETGAGPDTDEHEDVIQTTMGWYFDPASGQQRYDVLV